jgi:hypothetical protein
MNKERGAWLLPEGQKVWVEGREVPIVEEYKNQRQLLRECRKRFSNFEVFIEKVRDSTRAVTAKDIKYHQRLVNVMMNEIDNKLEGEDE